jgi:recombinational DNA repair protein RecR
VRRERLARARLAELELGEAAKQLARVKEVDRIVFTMARQALERLRTIPSKLRGSLAAETDPRACEALLDAEVAKVCEDLQKAAQALIAAPGSSAQAEAV